tara:strand:+ start:2916 stop:3179 length:264 start_codon:yes stop_codon:yes gene_type:complete
MDFNKILEQFQTDLENYIKENETKHIMDKDFIASQFENDLDELQEIVDGILGFDYQEAYNAQYDPETVTTPAERDRLAFEQKLIAKG